MISVAEYDLCLDLVVQVAIGNAFHASRRSDRHEDRRLNLSVVGRDEPGTSIGAGVSLQQLKGHSLSVVNNRAAKVRRKSVIRAAFAEKGELNVLNYSPLVLNQTTDLVDKADLCHHHGRRYETI